MRVTTSDRAVSDCVAFADFYVTQPQHNLLEMSASLSADSRTEHSAVLRVPTITLDQYVSDQIIERVYVIKIDVESQEHRVLSGATQLLRNHRPIIFLEVLAGSQTRTLNALREEHGYFAVQLHNSQLVCTGSLSIDRRATNQMLCPEERLHSIFQISQSRGYVTELKLDTKHSIQHEQAVEAH